MFARDTSWLPLAHALAFSLTFLLPCGARGQSETRSPGHEPEPSEITGAGAAWPQPKIVLRGAIERGTVGRRLEVPVAASGREAASFTFSVEPVPAGASFDNGARELRWTPRADQVGRHTLFVSVSDGHQTDTAPLEIDVQPKVLPRLLDVRRLEFVVGVTSTPLIVDRTGLDGVEIRAVGLPEGASFTQQPPDVRLKFTPRPDQVGSHAVVVYLNDGEKQVSRELEVDVVPGWARADYVTHLVMGGGYSAFLPIDERSYGVLHGPSVEWTVSAWRSAANSDTLACTSWASQCKASHRRLYARGDLLFSSAEDVPSGALYAAGFSSSVLWPASRRALIPHYGIEVGGLYHESIGHQVQVAPLLGLWLWTGDTLWVDVNVGYRVVPREITRLRGITGNLTAMLGRW